MFHSWDKSVYFIAVPNDHTVVQSNWKGGCWSGPIEKQAASQVQSRRRLLFQSQSRSRLLVSPIEKEAASQVQSRSRLLVRSNWKGGCSLGRLMAVNLSMPRSAQICPAVRVRKSTITNAVQNIWIITINFLNYIHEYLVLKHPSPRQHCGWPPVWHVWQV